LGRWYYTKHQKGNLMEFHFSTDDLPERDRFEAWADTMGRGLGLQRLPLADASGPFHATVSGRSLGQLGNLQVNADTHRTVRKGRDIANRHLNGYWVYREASAGAWFSHGGHEFFTRAGSLIIADADTPFDSQASGRLSYESWLVPKSLLNPHLPALTRPLSLELSGGNGVNALAASYLDALTRNWDDFSDATMVPVADTLARLIGVACGAAAGEHPDAVRAGRLVEAKGYINHHLADPELSAATVATSLGISVRTLHLLFEPSGSSFSRYVLRRRLEECRIALLGNPTRPVIDIAFAWGFNSLSSFYRTFKDAFGESPSDMRASAREAGLS
jgi:AraC-like DNA-binding protein